MSIQPPGTIRITGKLNSFSFLSGLKRGSQVPAIIIGRPGPGVAILDIAGNRIRAEFTKGVPANNNLILKLEGSCSDSYVFKLSGAMKKSDFFLKLLNITVFSVENFSKESIFEISRYIRSNPAGIYELNSFLLNIYKKEDTPPFKAAEMLNDMYDAGVNISSLQLLNLVFSGLRSKELLPFLILFGFESKYFDEIFKYKNKMTETMLSDIISLMDNITEKDREVLINRLVDFLVSDNNDFNKGEISVFEDGSFKPVYYIGNSTSWIISHFFSNIGRLELLFKKNDSSLDITFFSDDTEVIDALEEQAQFLYNTLKPVSDHLNLFFMNRRTVLDDISKINLQYTINSEFDVIV